MTIVRDYTALISDRSINGTFGRPTFYTYAFPASVPDYLFEEYSAAGLASFQPFSEAYRQLARDAIAQWGAASGLTFFEAAPGQGDIAFMIFDLAALGDPDSGGFAYYPGNSGRQPILSDIFINRSQTFGDSNLEILLHEIGHALGLKHPFEDDPILASDLDNTTQTVMSYTAQAGAGRMLGPLDRDAIAFLYGSAGQDGTQVARWSWDAARRTLAQAGDAAANRIFGVGAPDLIEGLEGDDTLFGRLGDDTLIGGAGADWLDGEGDNDTLDGGPGGDRLNGGPGRDVASFASLGAAVSADLGTGVALSSGERDTLFDIEGLIGTAFNDTLVGNGGDNWLDGGRGADVLRGAGGGDTYGVDDPGDVVDEAVEGLGLDLVRSSIDYALPASIENLVLVGDAPVSGRGNAGPNRIEGNAAANRLDGGSGDDTLLGGAGDDVLVGGAGRNWVDGGAGFDRLVTDASARGASIFSANGVTYILTAAESYRAVGVEDARFSDAQVSLDPALVARFDVFRYLASNPDLIPALGPDAAAAARHYDLDGFSAGRDPFGFDPLRYLASNADVLAAYGPDASLASLHYVVHGLNEGRDTKAFDARRYLASYEDLARAFGSNADAAVEHYVRLGTLEGRNPTRFDPNGYLAAYPDLLRAFGGDRSAATLHYLDYGRFEGRSDGRFDALRYAASYPDLARAFGTNAAAATAHFVLNGFAEGRDPLRFDAASYAAAYPDLFAVFGPNNAPALTQHYLTFGVFEGRDPFASTPPRGAASDAPNAAFLSDSPGPGAFETRMPPDPDPAVSQII